MKTTFDLNFELYTAVKQCTDTYKHRSQEKLSITLESCKLVIRLHCIDIITVHSQGNKEKLSSNSFSLLKLVKNLNLNTVVVFQKLIQ